MKTKAEQLKKADVKTDRRRAKKLRRDATEARELRLITLLSKMEHTWSTTVSGDGPVGALLLGITGEDASKARGIVDKIPEEGDYPGDMIDKEDRWALRRILEAVASDFDKARFDVPVDGAYRAKVQAAMKATINGEPARRMVQYYIAPDDLECTEPAVNSWVVSGKMRQQDRELFRRILRGVSAMYQDGGAGPFETPDIMPEL